MKKKGNSAAGRLFYTFGTIFLFALIAVCSLNFARDSRVIQTYLSSEAAEKNDNQGADENVTIKYNKEDTKTSAKTSSKPTTKTSSKTPAQDDPVASTNPSTNDKSDEKERASAINNENQEP